MMTQFMGKNREKWVFYGLVILISIFVPDEFIPTAFDSGGVTKQT